VLGPFQGRPACIRIPFGTGVCGVAAATLEVQRVDDVSKFPGHIACDGASVSELVVPIVRDGRLIAVLDLDSPELNRFDAEDEAGVVMLSALLAKVVS
jgi:L-methionine (R)-S-oxide reductase